MGGRLRAAWPLLLASFACGAPARDARTAATMEPRALATRETGPGRPPVAVVVRDGDPRGAVAVAVNTEGIATDHGATPGAVLAALVAQRLGSRGVEATAVGGWSGWRLRALVGTPEEATAVVEAIRAALLTPVGADEPAVAAATRRVEALRRRPLPSEALADVVRCTGDAYGLPGSPAATVAEIEAWRAAAHGLGRVALASAGGAAIADAVTAAIARSPEWPRAAALAPAPWPPADSPATTYDASGEIPSGAARIVVTAWTATPQSAVAAASGVGAERGPLASRLQALDSPARLRSVVATAHPDGGCLAATVDVSSGDLAADAPSRIATAAALTAQEVTVELADVPDDARDPIGAASDPRDAAERAAWWLLSGPRRGVAANDVRVHLTVGLAAPRDVAGGAAPATPDAIRSAIDRATLAWHVPVVDVRAAVERGQSEAWILLASPCGTAAEVANDAGLGAAVAFESSMAAQDEAGTDATAEPFVAPDGLGVLVHGRARVGEAPAAHARRLADLAARAFAADAIDPESATRARTRILLEGSAPEGRLREALATAVLPAHPSWVDPLGTLLGAGAASNDVIALHASALRAGPLRVAVLANVDAAQADAAARAVDRWIARRPGESRACPGVVSSPPARAGILTVARSPGSTSEAWLALPLAFEDARQRSAATWVAAALDGADGLLAPVLGAGTVDAPDAALARAWSAMLIGGTRAPALVVRVTADDDRLDAAVAQVRGVLQRLQREGLRAGELAHATTALASRRLTAALDPRTRAVALWRGEAEPPPPALDAVRAWAGSALRDDALVVVAARPHRPDGSASKR